MKLPYFITAQEYPSQLIYINEGAAKACLGACSGDESAISSSRNKILRSLLRMYFIFMLLVLLTVSCFCLGDIIQTTDGSSYEGEIADVSIRTSDGEVYNFSGEDVSRISIGHVKEKKDLDEPNRDNNEDYQEEDNPKRLPERIEEKKEEITTQETGKEPRKDEVEEKEEKEATEDKPFIITPQIKGLDSNEYKTY